MLCSAVGNVGASHIRISTAANAHSYASFFDYSQIRTLCNCKASGALFERFPKSPSAPSPYSIPLNCMCTFSPLHFSASLSLAHHSVFTTSMIDPYKRVQLQRAECTSDSLNYTTQQHKTPVQQLYTKLLLTTLYSTQHSAASCAFFEVAGQIRSQSFASH